MAEVFLSDFGSGHTTTDALPPMSEGEVFHLYFHPDAGAELLQVSATDSHDYAVALPEPVNDEIEMQFRTAWGNLYVESYYSGSTPPEPQFPIWLLLILKRRIDKRLRKC